MDSPQPTPQKYEETILRQNLQRWRACGEPEAWAQYRDVLPKCLPWFYDVEAGVCLTTTTKGHPLYSQTRNITGLLISTYPAVNSYIDAEVIIVSSLALFTAPADINRLDLTLRPRKRGGTQTQTKA